MSGALENLLGFRSGREKEEIPGEGGGPAQATALPSLGQQCCVPAATQCGLKSLQILELLLG